MIETLNTLSGHWYHWQIAMLWQTAVLIAIIAGLDLLIRRWAWPQVRYALWMLVLVKLLVPPTLTSPASITAHLPAAAHRAATVMERADSSPPAADLTHALAPTGQSDPAPQRQTAVNGTQASSLRQHEQQTGVSDADQTTAATGAERIVSADPPADLPVSLSWTSYAMLVWLAGIGVLSAWLLRRLSGLRKGYTTCHPGPRAGIQSDTDGNPLPERFSDQLRAAADRLNLKRLPQVILTDRVSCPAVFGIFRPVLLMPAETFKHMSTQETEHILLHELAHIKRGDLLVHGLYMTLQIAYWFNPLLWMIRRTLQNLRELCCDATVARLLREDTAGYRQTLLETARRLLAEPVDPGLGLLGLFENSNWLITRLHWLEKKTWKNRPLRIAVIVLLVAVMTTCVLPMANRTDPGSESFVKTVDGARIELVAVNQLGAKDGWWNPDGSPCRLAIDTEDHNQYPAENPGYELVFRIDGAQNPMPRLAIKGGNPQSGLQVNSPEGLIGWRSHIKAGVKQTKVQLGILGDNWQTIATHSGRGTEARVIGRGKVVFSPVQQTDSGLSMTVSDDLDFAPAKRLVAVDQSGTVHPGQTTGNLTFNGLHQLTQQFDGLAPGDIKEFQFQTQDYTWVTFKDVALRPQTEGDFKVTGTVTDAVTGQPIAGAEVFDDGYNDGVYRTTADENGRFTLYTAKEEHTITAKAEGYQTQTKILKTWPFTNNKDFDFELKKADLDAEVISDSSDSIGKINLSVGTIGTVVFENGDAIYGSEKEYSSLMYLGRVKQDQKVELMDKNIYYNQYSIPIVKVKTQSSSWAAVSKGTVGWILLNGTNFAGAFEQKPDDQLPLHFKKLKEERFETAMEEYRKWRQETDPNSEQESTTSELQTQNFTATLPNGVTVELLGLCEHPSFGKRWWMPNGDLLEETPYDDEPYGRAFPKWGESGYKFAVKFSGMAYKDIEFMVIPSEFIQTQRDYITKKNGVENTKYVENWVDEKIVAIGASFVEETENCDIEVGVCFGKWRNEYRYEDDKPDDAVEWVKFKNVSLRPNFDQYAWLSEKEQILRNAESQARLLNHEYIGTEHILLGLVAEKTGTVSQILNDSGITGRQVYDEILQLVKKSNRVVFKKNLPMTDRAILAFKNATQLAKESNSDTVNSIHVLLGLMKVEEAVGAQILINLGLNFERAQETVFLNPGSTTDVKIENESSASSHPAFQKGDFDFSTTKSMTLYGRVVFQNLKPAYVSPSLVGDQQKTYIMKPSPDIEAGTGWDYYADADSNGCFSIQLSKEDYESIKDKKTMLAVMVPNKTAFTEPFTFDIHILSPVENTPALIKLPFNNPFGDNNSYTATLSNGVTVELVGLCEHPSEGKQWWKPDGSPFTLPEGLVIKESSRVDTDDKAYAFLFKYQFEDQISASYDIESASSIATMSTAFPGGGTRGYIAEKVHFKEPPDKTTVRISVSVNSQETKTRHDETVTFKNVSLTPGVKTDVQIAVDDGQSTKEEEKEAWNGSGLIPWSQVAATLSTLRTGIRVWGAKNPTAAGSWTQDELTLGMLGFEPKDVTGNYFSDKNYTWQVFRNGPYKELTYKITATADNKWMAIDQDHNYTNGKQTKQSSDFRLQSDQTTGVKTDAEIETQPSVPGLQSSGEKQTLQVDLNSLFLASQVYHIDNGKWPETVDVLLSKEGNGPYMKLGRTHYAFDRTRFVTAAVNGRKDADPKKTPFFYDVSLLERRNEVAVVFLDGHLECYPPDQLKTIGITLRPDDQTDVEITVDEGESSTDESPKIKSAFAAAPLISWRDHTRDVFAIYRVLGHVNAPSFGKTRKDICRPVFFGSNEENRFDAMRPENYPLDGLIFDEEPLLTENDIVFYDWQKQQIHLKPGVKDRLPNAWKPPVVFGIPFVVVVNGQRIYLGAFWTGASSYMANMPTITLEPWGHEPPLPDDVIQISMGGILKAGQQPTYPNRDQQIRLALHSVGKLKTDDTNPALRPGSKTDVEVKVGNPEQSSTNFERTTTNYKATRPPDATPEGGTGDLLGAVVDSHSKGIGGVFVFICGQDNGIPLSPKTRQPFTKQLGRPEELKLLYTVTDDDGNFIFKDIPAGKYRLVSQSWKDAKQIKGALEVNGKEIHLHGIAENIHASPAASPYRIELRPLGSGILQLDADLPNDETLLVVSTSPTQADPILGFAGWSGTFMQHMIGGNRMPHGQTTIYGLPEGTLYLAMFAADNSPGFAEAQAAVKPNETTVLDHIQFVAGWSDARHTPPKELLPVFEEIKPLVLSKAPFLLELFREYGLMEIEPEKGPWKFMDVVSRNLTKKITLPSGRTATFGEIAAAWKYVELQQWTERRENRRFRMQTNR